MERESVSAGLSWKIASTMGKSLVSISDIGDNGRRKFDGFGMDRGGGGARTHTSLFSCPYLSL